MLPSNASCRDTEAKEWFFFSLPKLSSQKNKWKSVLFNLHDNKNIHKEKLYYNDKALVTRLECIRGVTWLPDNRSHDTCIVTRMMNKFLFYSCTACFFFSLQTCKTGSHVASHYTYCIYTKSLWGLRGYAAFNVVIHHLHESQSS